MRGERIRKRDKMQDIHTKLGFILFLFITLVLHYASYSVRWLTPIAIGGGED